MSGRQGELKRLREQGYLFAQLLIGHEQFSDKGLESVVLHEWDGLFFRHVLSPFLNRA